MEEWTRVVVTPLGLAGFALFLLFGSFARRKRRGFQSWALFTIGTLALIAGIGLAYQQGKPASEFKPAAQESTPQPPPTIKVDKIEQKGNTGTTVGINTGTLDTSNVTESPETKK